MEWKVIESKKLFSEPWFNVRKDICELPNGKKHQAYYVLEYPSWVNGFAITEEGKVIMIRQYRHGLGVMSTEIPGGVVDKGETPEQAVIRELKEETGYEFETIESIGKISANPSTSNNYTHMFLMTGGKKTGEQKLDDTEDIEVMIMDIAEVKTLVRENKIVQSLHTATIFYALERLGQLAY